MVGSPRSNARPILASSWQGYFADSRRPLEILFFLLPFIALYEYELARVLRSEGGLLTNGAHLTILKVFSAVGLGEGALSVPGILIVVILLCWNALERRPWVVDLSVVVRMYVESIALAVPLLVFAQIVVRALPAAGVTDFGALAMGERIAVSIGAGLYEELVFRMALIALLQTLLSDVLGLSSRAGTACAIGLGAIAFTAYHPLRDGAGVVVPQRAVFFLGAGIYFGIVYVQRGFGIVVATHALYDIATAFLVDPPAADGG